MTSPKSKKPKRSALDELVDRALSILDKQGAVIVSGARTVRRFRSEGFSLYHDVNGKVVRVSLTDKFDAESMVYSGPDNDRFRAYIHNPGIKEALVRLRKHMVLDDLGAV